MAIVPFTVVTPADANLLRPVDTDHQQILTAEEARLYVGDEITQSPFSTVPNGGLYGQ